MKKISTFAATMILLACMAAGTSWAAGGKVRGDKASGPAGDAGSGLVCTNRGGETGDCCQTMESLSEIEVAHILYMRQEEKLARDVYLALYDHYVVQDPLTAQIFWNIAASEQRHMAALRRLIDCYGLEDPVSDDTVGVFPDSEDGFAEMYDDLVAQGMIGNCEAFGVGMDIENMDIMDIEEALLDVEIPKVARVLNNLLAGSYNHLEAFTGRMTSTCP